MLAECTTQKITEKYIIDEDQFIGQYKLRQFRGSYAKVVKGREIKTGRVVAIKIIKKQKMNEQEQILLEREIYIMKNISHPNIVQFYDYYADMKYIYLVLEYLSGGQLYQEIVIKQTYTQEQARKVISPIVDAIRYLHECGIVHRDLKPQNVVFSSNNQDKVLKLIDFGVSQMIPNDTHLMSTAVGTPLYMAPQILSGQKYDEEVDWWAIGIILYVLLCGYPPFQSQNEVDLKNQIYKMGVKFDQDDWQHISDEAKDLVSKLLTVEHKKRINAEEIINHPWMINEARTKPLANVQDNLKKFASKIRQIRNAIKAVRIMQNFKKNE